MIIETATNCVLQLSFSIAIITPVALRLSPLNTLNKKDISPSQHESPPNFHA